MRKAHRLHLLTTQFDITVLVGPWLSICSFLLIFFLIVPDLAQSGLAAKLAWLASASALQIPAWHAWVIRSKKGAPLTAKNNYVRKTVILAALLGIVWGALPNVLLSASEYADAVVLPIGMTMVLCGAAFGFAPIPQAVIAFVLPMFAGLTTALIRLSSGIEVWAAMSLFALTAFCLPFITIQYARHLVNNVKAEIESKENKKLVSLLLNEYEENSGDWIWELDTSGRIHHASQRFIEVAGLEGSYTPDIVFADFLAEVSENKRVTAEIGERIENRQPFRNLEIPVTIDGESRFWKVSGKPNFDESGDFMGYLGIGQDITLHRNNQSEIRHLALNDALTGLVNRAEFNRYMDHAVTNLERTGTPFTVMYLDLDKFKLVNDMRGHLVGDCLLKMVAERMQSITRKSDVVARLGGDEFAIIMFNTCDEGVAARLASKLIQQISKPYEIDGEQLKIGLSVGIALAPQNGTQAVQLLRNADLALYRSKEDGRGVFRFFESRMDTEQRERRMLEMELRKAIDENEFELFFHPMVDAKTKKVDNMEALIRWNHPIRGVVLPGEFIPLAEKSALIQEIGAWTMRNACRAAAQWPEELKVSVNLSPQHFVGSDIVLNTEAALKEYNLHPERLEIEVTESLLIDNTEEVYQTLSRLKQLGISIALDDFGTGYSSLSYLLKYKFDKLKIDKSFVRNCLEDTSAQAILKMITALGKSLNMTITAEGVELKEQANFLSSIDCDQLQGYLFSKPMNELAIAPFLVKHADNYKSFTKAAKEEKLSAA